MSQIENHLGCFSENPTRFHKEFLCITQASHVTWADLYYILSATLSPDKSNHIWQSAREYADQLATWTKSWPPSSSSQRYSLC
jgi:hypothetical protein